MEMQNSLEYTLNKLLSCYLSGSRLPAPFGAHCIKEKKNLSRKRLVAGDGIEPSLSGL